MTQLCVIFDLDGTLCDTNAVDDDCYRQAAAAALGVPSPEIDWTDAPHITDSGIARWLWERLCGCDPLPDELHRFRQEFLRRLEARRAAEDRAFQPIQGAPQFVDSLLRRGAILGIGTGGWRASAELKLGAAGIDPHLLYATADDAEARVDIFSLAWTRATAHVAQPLATVLVGDTASDVATARTLGWRFLGVGTGAGAVQLLRAGANVIVSDLADFSVLATLQRIALTGPWPAASDDAAK